MAIAVERIPAIAYPTQGAAALMLGVNESTLSRHDVERIKSGKAKHIPARQVLELARTRYRNRLVSEVAFDLVEYANVHCAKHAGLVEQEVDAFLRKLRQPEADRQEWLAQAKKYLPAELYVQAAAAVQETRGDPRGSLIGVSGSNEDD